MLRITKYNLALSIFSSIQLTGYLFLSLMITKRKIKFRQTIAFLLITYNNVCVFVSPLNYPSIIYHYRYNLIVFFFIKIAHVQNIIFKIFVLNFFDKTHKIKKGS